MKNNEDIFEIIKKASIEKRLILFCGAGISIKSPSNLPSSLEIIRQISDNLAKGFTEQQKDFLSKALQTLSSVPFELSLSIIGAGKYLKLRDILSPLIREVPNSNHKFIADLLINRYIQYIITTNFDVLIEKEFELNDKKLDVFYNFNNIWDIERISNYSLIKIHGSLDDLNSIKTTTENIRKSYSIEVLSKWGDFLNNKCIIFVGYGGGDKLDILPILMNLKNTSLIWLNHREHNSFNIIKDYSHLSHEMKFVFKRNKVLVSIP
jgi:hypothetical protein